MTTTLSSPPATAASASLPAYEDPLFTSVRASRRFRRLMVIAWAIAIPVAVSWAALRWSTQAAQLADVTTYTVAPQSFIVALKEKGELKAAKSTDIICEVEGRSTIIYLIPEGTAVQEGDLLVELASDQIEDRIRQEELKEANAITAFEAAKSDLEIQRDQNASDTRKADLQIELKRLGLEKYLKGDWEQALKDANIEIERSTIALEREAEDFRAAEELRAKDFITKTDYETDEFNFKKAQWDLDRANRFLDVLRTYTHVADRRQKESDVQEAEKEGERVKKNADAAETQKVRTLEGKTKELGLIQDQLAKLRTQKEKCRIFAPTQGFVVYYAEGGGRHFMSGDNQVKEGASVHERQILLSLPDTSAMTVAVRIHEAKTDKLQVGQQAVVRVEGLPDNQFTGSVTKIAVLADSQNRWLNPDLKEYETEISLERSDVQLKPGVTAYVEIQVETVEDRLAVPVQTIYGKGGRRYVFRDASSAPVPVDVKLGAIGTDWAEVAEGLTPGDRVLLAFTDEHKRLIPELPQRAGATDQRRDRRAQHQMARPQETGSDRPPGRRPDGREQRGPRPGHTQVQKTSSAP